MPLFERGHAGGALGGGFSGSVALAAQGCEAVLPGGKLRSNRARASSMAASSACRDAIKLSCSCRSPPAVAIRVR